MSGKKWTTPTCPVDKNNNWSLKSTFSETCLTLTLSSTTIEWSTISKGKFTSSWNTVQEEIWHPILRNWKQKNNSSLKTSSGNLCIKSFWLLMNAIRKKYCTETSNLQISSLIKISQETPISNWEILGSVENWESILSSLKPMWEHLTTWVQNRSRKAGTIKSLISGQLGVFFMKLPV